MVSIHFNILALDYSITNKVIRYLLAKNQFSWCSLNPKVIIDGVVGDYLAELFEQNSMVMSADDERGWNTSEANTSEANTSGILLGLDWHQDISKVYILCIGSTTSQNLQSMMRVWCCIKSNFTQPVPPGLHYDTARVYLVVVCVRNK